MFEISQDYQDIIEKLKNKIIPEAYPVSLNPAKNHNNNSFDILKLSPMLVRDEIIRLSGYSMISYNWIRPLSKWIGNRKCLEVMAGSGVWSKALQDCGVSVIATDNPSWYVDLWQRSPWTEIEQIDCIEAIEKYGKNMNFVLCSWPPMNKMCYYILLKMRKINPDLKMIYIGENGGATGCEEFFNEVQQIEDSTFEKAVSKYTQIHFSIHDYPFLFK
ncbi:MAG: hypothetical protein LBI03_07515 [Clostridiales bacterium]|jgi:hypothetical protein|nr:hypothetical protein [Clostridiales bacterium]